MTWEALERQLREIAMGQSAAAERRDFMALRHHAAGDHARAEQYEQSARLARDTCTIALEGLARVTAQRWTEQEQTDHRQRIAARRLMYPETVRR
jgi:hypothetical protein